MVNITPRPLSSPRKKKPRSYWIGEDTELFIQNFVGNPSNCQLMNTIVERRNSYFSVFVCRSQGHTHILQQAGLLAIRKMELGEVNSHNKTN